MSVVHGYEIATQAQQPIGAMDIARSNDSNGNVAQRKFGPLAKGVIGTTAGILLLSACNPFSSDSEEVERLELPSGEIEALCNNPPYALGEYESEVGIGPFNPIEAASVDAPQRNDVALEAATDLGLGNAMGVALTQAVINQQSAAYNPTPLFTETQDIFDRTFDDREQFSESCVVAAEGFLESGELREIKAENVTEFTNLYESGVLVSLDPVNEAETQGLVEVFGIPDENGATLAGVVVNDEARNGRFVIAQIQDEGGNNIDNADAPAGQTTDTTEAPAGVDVTIIEGPNGEEIEVTVTTIPGPDGEPVEVATIPGPDGTPIVVNPETGEPTGEPLPEGILPEQPGSGGGGADTTPDTVGTDTSGPSTTQAGPGTTDAPGTSAPGSTVTPGTTPTGSTTPAPSTTTGTTTPPATTTPTTTPTTPATTTPTTPPPTAPPTTKPPKGIGTISPPASTVPPGFEL